MSKYNIDDIVCGSPFINDYTKSELTPPSAIREFVNKISNTNKIIDKINSVCKIVFLGDVIVFTPRIRAKTSKKDLFQRMVYARDHIRKLLCDLGFDTYVYQDMRYCATVSLSLREPKNKQRLQQLGNVFKFMYKSPVLTQSILDSIKQHKR
ncbi:MAG: hypothetical protein UIC65_03810 [Alphaproteobacteria bacterium]|nr:hypothetical protein [Alphaproteobacteria bacterium]